MTIMSPSQIEHLVYIKTINEDFSCVEAFLELSFCVDGNDLKIQTQTPYFLSVLVNTLSIDSCDFSKYNIDEPFPGVFALSLPAQDFVNSPDVAVPSLLMTGSQKVNQKYFNPSNTPVSKLEKWGNNLISLEQSLQQLGLYEPCHRGACAKAQWEEIGLLLLQNAHPPSPRPTLKIS